MFSKVMQLYEEMSGLQLEPDVFTLTSLITACDQVGGIYTSMAFQGPRTLSV